MNQSSFRRCTRFHSPSALQEGVPPPRITSWALKPTIFSTLILTMHDRRFLSVPNRLHLYMTILLFVVAKAHLITHPTGAQRRVRLAYTPRLPITIVHPPPRRPSGLARQHSHTTHLFPRPLSNTNSRHHRACHPPRSHHTIYRVGKLQACLPPHHPISTALSWIPATLGLRRRTWTRSLSTTSHSIVPWSYAPFTAIEFARCHSAVLIPACFSDSYAKKKRIGLT